MKNRYNEIFTRENAAAVLSYSLDLVNRESLPLRVDLKEQLVATAVYEPDCVRPTCSATPFCHAMATFSNAYL